MKLAEVQPGMIYYIPDHYTEAEMIERAIRDQLVILVYQGNDLIGHIDKKNFTAVPRANIQYQADAPKIYAYIPGLVNEYIQIMPGTYSQQRATILEENEFYLLVDLLNTRMVEASKQGIPDDHDSQVFRDTLLKKLIPFLRKPLVMISEPTSAITEAYKK